MADTLLDDVAELLHRAAADVVLPLFGKLDVADVAEKAPGELVTVADQRAEELISAGLRRLRPGSLVVGEEAAAEDPGLLDHLRDDGDVWLVDPIDGTSNFAAGKRPFALMVALLTDGMPVASWVLDPLAETLAVARAGEGTLVNGGPVRTAEEVPPLGSLRGTAMTRFLPPEAGGAPRPAGNESASCCPASTAPAGNISTCSSAPSSSCSSGAPCPGTTPRGCCWSARQAGWPAGSTAASTTRPKRARACWSPRTIRSGPRPSTPSTWPDRPASRRVGDPAGLPDRAAIRPVRPTRFATGRQPCVSIDIW